jgi:leucyl-tRNA synthetase
MFLSSGNNYVQKDTGEKVEVKYEKMSKSKHNGIDPEVTILWVSYVTVKHLVKKQSLEV